VKIRHPFLVRLCGFVIAWLVRLWVGTVRYRDHFEDPASDPRRRDPRRHYIYAFWHETMLMPAVHYGRLGVHVLISQHADGEMIARAAGHLGYGLVRGSTTRGGAGAMRQMLRLKDHAHLCITPDGPRGPRRCVQPGLIYLAARTGLPIVPAGIGYQKCWRMRSWDRFAIPWPYCAARALIGAPIHVPAGLSRDEMEQYRLRVEQEMNRLTEEAEARAARESW
jgi:lysophospholipid acyltransferase (LPLAT)-like uncharacterized protein